MPYFNPDNATATTLNAGVVRARRHPAGLYQIAGAAGATAMATLALAADRLHLMRFDFTTADRFDQIAIDVTTGGAGGTRVTLCIYRPGTDGFPGALVWYSAPLLADAAAAVTALFSTGTKVLTADFISDTYSPVVGDAAWLGVWTEAAPTLRGLAVGGADIINLPAPPWAVGSAITFVRRSGLVWTTGAPPDPAGAVTGITGTSPAVGLRTAA